MKNYTNGYQDKINYWRNVMIIRRDSGDVEGVVHALRKLNYFLNRQVEVYGDAGIGHSRIANWPFVKNI